MQTQLTALTSSYKPLCLSLLAALAFLLLGLQRVYHHELWMDETEPWLLARDSHSLRELLHNHRYESHPLLWYLLLYAVTGITHQVFVLQVLHVCIAAASVFMLFRYAPFPLLMKLLLAGGYFVFYEYCVLSRLYAPGMLGIFIVCTLYPHRHRYWLWFSLALFLLAHINLFGFILAAGTVLLWLSELVFPCPSEPKPDHKRLLIGAAIVLSGLALSLITMIPPPDTFFSQGWHFYFSGGRLLKALGTLWSAFIPVPVPVVEFWNSNIVQNLWLKAIGGTSIWLVGCLFFTKNPRVLLLYLFVSGGALLFFYLKYLGLARHHGHLFIYFIACLWLAQGAGIFTAKTHSVNWKPGFLYALLLVQLAAGFFASYVDLKYPFSPNRQAADFLAGLPYRYNLVSQDNFHTTALSAYLHRPVYYAGLGRFGSFYQLSVLDKNMPDAIETLTEAGRLAQKTGLPSVVVLNKTTAEATKGYQHLLTTKPTVLGYPVYRLYLVP